MVVDSAERLASLAHHPFLSCIKLVRPLLALDAGHLMDFDAQVRRTWFSARESLRGAWHPGALWLPGRINLDPRYVTVSTDESVTEFYPRHLTWRSPISFTLSGSDKRGRLRRAIVGLNTPERAQTVANWIQSQYSVNVEPLPTIDEMPVILRFAALRNELVLLILSIYGRRLLVILIIISILPTIAAYSFWLGIVLLAILFIPPRTFLRMFSRLAEKRSTQTRKKQRFDHRITGKLRLLDGRTLELGYSGYRWPVEKLKRVEWDGPNQFTIEREEMDPVKLEFVDHEEAMKAVIMIKKAFPDVG